MRETEAISLEPRHLHPHGHRTTRALRTCASSIAHATQPDLYQTPSGTLAIQPQGYLLAVLRARQKGRYQQGCYQKGCYQKGCYQKRAPRYHCRRQ
jgi:hypothetical protein